jgi:methylated-DNA-[protein]-cysteine S-methyltransferase
MTPPVLYTTVASPIGELLLVGDGRSLQGLYMREGRRPIAVRDEWTPFDAVRMQLGEYFAGERTVFDIPLTMGGTPFQRRVWQALRDIPYGKTTTYGELAARVGEPVQPAPSAWRTAAIRSP